MKTVTVMALCAAIIIAGAGLVFAGDQGNWTDGSCSMTDGGGNAAHGHSCSQCLEGTDCGHQTDCCGGGGHGR